MLEISHPVRLETHVVVVKENERTEGQRRVEVVGRGQEPGNQPDQVTGKDENEKVIYRKRFFNPIGRLELRKFLDTHVMINDCAKPHGKRNPNGRPHQGFPIADGVGVFLENA